MIKHTNNRINYSLLFNRYTLIIIAMILFYFKLYVLTSIYILFISLLLILVDRKVFKNKIRNYFLERKKLKNLNYYYITDDNKTIDLRKRKDTYGLFQDLAMGTFVIFIFNFISLYYLLQYVFDTSSILNLIMLIGFIVTIVIAYGGILAGIVYKYTTTIYVLIPGLSAFIYFVFIEPFIGFAPIFIRLTSYLLITLSLYLILAFVFPVHVLRKLNSKTVLISSFLTISATILTQVISFYFLKYLRTENYFLTGNDAETVTGVSDTLRNIIVENTELIDIINYFIEREASNQLTSIISLVITTLTISYIIGGLVINRKIEKNRLKAKSLFRELLKNTFKVDYQILKQCSFYGGEEYENLILNNSSMLEVVMDNEPDLNNPRISRMKRLIAWYKRKSILYSILKELKQIRDSN